MYIYVYIYTHTYIHIYIHIYIYKCLLCKAAQDEQRPLLIHFHIVAVCVFIQTNC